MSTPKTHSTRWSILSRITILGLAPIFALITILMITPVVYADTIMVNTNADELNNNGNCSLREAIQAANTNTAVDNCAAGNGADIINLPAGTYTLAIAGAGENLNATGDLDITEELTIQGSGEATTIIDAAGLDRALHTVAAVKLTVHDLQVINGSVGDENGGGINATGDLHLQNTGIYSNTTSNVIREGGGVYVTGTSVFTNTTFIGNANNWYGGGASLNVATLNNVLFLNNTTSLRGGGVYIRGGGVKMTGGSFENNRTTLTNNASAGGGAYLLSTGTISGTTFIDNAVTVATANTVGGGGLYAQGQVTLNNTTFLRNSSTTSGGGAYLNSSGNTVNNMTAISNTATYGGGLFLRNTSGLVSGGHFEQNTSTQQGGGILSGFGGGGGLTIDGTTFISNTAGLGGGVYINRFATLRNLRLIGNEATDGSYGGGGLTLWQGTFQVENSLFVNNTSPLGTAITAWSQSGSTTLNLEHNTLVGSAVNSTVYIGTLTALASTGNIYNNIFANHAVAIENGNSGNTVVTEDYNLYDTVTQQTAGTVNAGGNSFTGTAGFVSAGAGDYHLTLASPALNTGTDVGVTVDIDGDARPQRGGFDIGFDEVPDDPSAVTMSSAETTSDTTFIIWIFVAVSSLLIATVSIVKNMQRTK